MLTPGADEKNTSSTIDVDGWIHTGDVGLIDECGRLKIIDRVKVSAPSIAQVCIGGRPDSMGPQNIMKLAQGEYVALENIENVYSSCPLVAQAFVYGDSLQSYLLAVIVPDPVLLSNLLAKLGRNVSADDLTALEEAVGDPKVNAAVLSEITKTAEENQLKGYVLLFLDWISILTPNFALSFEMVKRIHLTMEPFSVENGCLTPTFKIKRYAKLLASTMDSTDPLPQERDVCEVQASARRPLRVPSPDHICEALRCHDIVYLSSISLVIYRVFRCLRKHAAS